MEHWRKLTVVSGWKKHDFCWKIFSELCLTASFRCPNFEWIDVVQNFSLSLVFVRVDCVGWLVSEVSWRTGKIRTGSLIRRRFERKFTFGVLRVKFELMSCSNKPTCFVSLPALTIFSRVILICIIEIQKQRLTRSNKINKLVAGEN